MAEKVTIKLEVDISDLEEMEESAEDAGEEMESTFDSIKDKIKETFTGDTFDSIKNALEGLNDIINDAVLGAVQALTDRLGILGDAIERVVKAVLNMKDQLLVGPINAFAGAVQALDTILKGLLESIPAVGDGLARMTDGFQSLIPVIISLSSLMQGFVSTQLAVLPGAIASVTGALGGLAVSFGASFQNQFKQVSSVMTGVNADMREFRKSVLQIADELPQGTQAVTQAMRQVVKAGITTREVVTTITDRLLRLAEISDGTAKSLSQNLIQILTAFGTLDDNPSESVRALTDDIRTLTEQTRAGVPQLIKAMSRIAPVANQVGASASKVGALGATIIQAGQEASRGGTRMRRAFQEIISSLADVEAQEDLADIMGVETEELRSDIQNDFIGVIRQIGNEVANSERNLEAFAEVLGVTGEAGATALGALASRFDLFKSLLEDIEANAGSVDRAFQEATDSIFKQGRIILGLLNNTAKRLGTALLEPITQFATTVVDRLQMVQDEVRDIATIIEENIQETSQNISDLFGLTQGESFKLETFLTIGNEFTSAVGSVFSDVFNNVVIPLGKTFALNTVIVLRQGLRSLFDNLFSDTFLNIITSTFNIGIQALADGWNRFIKPIIIATMKEASNIIAEGLTNTLPDLSPGFDVIGGTPFEDTSPQIPEGGIFGQRTEDAIRQQQTAFQTAQEEIGTNFIQTLKNVFSGEIIEGETESEVKDSITTILTTAFPERPTTEIIKKVEEIINQLFGGEDVTKSADKASESVNNFELNMESLRNEIDKVNKTVTDTAIEMTNIGAQLRNQLFRGEIMPQQAPDIARRVSDAFSGFQDMLFQEEPLSTQQVNRFAQKFRNQFGKSITEVTDTDNLQQAIKTARGNLKNIITELLPEKAKDIQQIQDTGNQVVNEFGKGIEGAIKGEDVDVTGNIADVFTQTFSEKLTREVTKSLKTQKTAEQVANLVVSSINFIFQIIKNALKSKKNRETISQIASTAFSAFTGGSGGQRKGGPIGFASGGQVKGQGGIDQISAMLSRGEFVVRREAVNAQTLPFLKQLNANKGMRQGGSVGNTSSSMPANGQGGQRDVNINITAVDANSFQQLVENNPEVITNQILKDLDKNGRTRKAMQQKVDR